MVIYFSKEEWTLLDDPQRHLYHHVMMEVFVLMSSLSKPPSHHSVRASCLAWLLLERDVSFPNWSMDH